MEKKEKNMKIAKIGKAFMTLGAILVLLSLVKLSDNILTDEKAGEKAEYILSQVKEQVPEMENHSPDSIGIVHPTDNPNKNTEMVSVEVEGESYIGTVEIPVLGIELPVLSRWDDALAKTSPCRYKGSVTDGSLIISGHNYKRHFGRLSSLSIGNSVIFKDINGTVYLYMVSEIEIIDKYDVEGMEVGEWDMTLFTCTIGGKQRVTIRCRAL